MITLDMLVYTDIREEIGKAGAEEVRLTFSKTKPLIIGYDRVVGDGVYIYQLKQLSEQYKKQGLSWEEADEHAYKDLLAEIEAYLESRRD